MQTNLYLYYLDLALPNDDDTELHDYFNIQFHAMFEFHPGVKVVLQENGDKNLFIKSLTITLISTTSHPPGPEVQEGSNISIFLAVGTISTIHMDSTPHTGCQQAEKYNVPISRPTLGYNSVRHTTQTLCPKNVVIPMSSSLAGDHPGEAQDCMHEIRELTYCTFKHFCLPQGILHELEWCIYQEPGFERIHWEEVLCANYVCDDLQPHILGQMDELEQFISCIDTNISYGNVSISGHQLLKAHNDL
ncbi:hypothetical protein EDC04DRAFT_2611012 [Pisolithus marmoratus]|nr:hypothetical protein EDC04DRAFT_2611012 [Pisolithus marmoratus]